MSELAPRRGMLTDLAAAFGRRWRRKSGEAALSRAALALRHLPVLVMARPLFANPAWRRHMEQLEDRPGPLFFLDRYLARGIAPRERAALALHHYRNELHAFDGDYFEAVYRRGGLRLWQARAGEHRFEIKLTPGADVPDEGAASVIAYHGDRVMCVMSYSTVPIGRLTRDTSADAHEPTLFIVRKQMSTDRGYQAAFHEAFDRSTPAHFCFAALSAVAAAQGIRRVIGISAAANLSCSPEYEAQFKVAYDDFWRSLCGKPAAPYGWEIDLPMQLTPLQRLDAKARKRAVARRAHLDAIATGAEAIVRRHLRAQRPAATPPP